MSDNGMVFAAVLERGRQRTPEAFGPMMGALATALKGPVPPDGFEYRYQHFNAAGALVETSRPRPNRLRFTPLALRAAFPDHLVVEQRRPAGSDEEWQPVA